MTNEPKEGSDPIDVFAMISGQVVIHYLQS